MSGERAEGSADASTPSSVSKRRRRIAVWVTVTILVLGVAGIARWYAWHYPEPSFFGSEVAERVTFERYEAEYRGAVALLQETRGTPAYSEELPSEYRFLTAHGSVDVRIDERFEHVYFFPLWTGIPDDAGGYWYTGGPSPVGRDMSGMTCTNPIQMNEDWWACGLAEDSDKLPRLDSNQ